MKSFHLVFSFILMMFSTLVLADNFSANATYSICFTPEENCTQSIINEINNAKRQILLQMYMFTSRPIAKALVAAKKRGVEVVVLLDKSQIEFKNFPIKYFIYNGISVYIDSIDAIAHNKLLMIDGMLTIGGSFNFTNRAQKHNAENVLIIKDTGLTKKYIKNWYNRKQKSFVVSY